jgi:hypothetical protein
MASENKVTLREFIESKIAALEQLFYARLTAVDEATKLSREALDARLETMNGFRQALHDASRTYITRTEHEVLTKQIESLELSRAEAVGRSSMATFLAVISILVAIASVAVAFVRH